VGTILRDRLFRPGSQPGRGGKTRRSESRACHGWGGGLVVVAGGDVPAVETEKGGRRAKEVSKTCSVGTGMSGGYRCRR
jgi:hypothetical protein